MQQTLSNLSASLSTYANQIANLAMATANAADGVWDVQTMVLECQNYAEQRDYLTLDNATGAATVSLITEFTTDKKKSDENTAENLRRSNDCLELQGMVSDTLKKAEEVDSTYSSELGGVASGSCSSGGSGCSFPGAGAPPSSDWSPTEASTWWKALTQAKRDSIIADHPEWVGNLDGVDAHSRHQANMNRLDAEIEAARAEAAEAQLGYDQRDTAGEARGPDEPVATYDQLWFANGRLADLLATQQQLQNRPDQSLLVLDASGNDRVRVAVATGDVDTADHVATFTPGMSSAPASTIGDYMKFAEDLTTEALKQSEGSSVAAVTWIGYDAPSGLGQPRWTEVTDTERAEAGAEQLQSFTEGINSSRIGTAAGEPDQTVLGHSYGSTTAGDAAATSSAGVIDQLVMFGSPGSGVQDIHEYNLDPDHVYVSAVDSHDVVQGLGTDGNFGINPDYMDGITHLSNDTPDPGPGLNVIGRHSSYMASGSGALADIARVVVGAEPEGESPESVAERHAQQDADPLHQIFGKGPW